MAGPSIEHRKLPGTKRWDTVSGVVFLWFLSFGQRSGGEQRKRLRSRAHIPANGVNSTAEASYNRTRLNLTRQFI